jgi:hypothetical protein
MRIPAMEYVIAICVIAVVLFFAVKKTTNSFYELGRLSLSKEDYLDFLSREVGSLSSDSDKAIFHFLINRPWRETRDWFQSVYSFDNELGKSKDIEVIEFKKSMKEAMLGHMDKPLELLMKLKGLPQEVRQLEPRKYAEWTNLNQTTLAAFPQFTVSRFVSASSVMAAQACLKA